MTVHCSQALVRRTGTLIIQSRQRCPLYVHAANRDYLYKVLPGLFASVEAIAWFGALAFSSGLEAPEIL